MKSITELHNSRAKQFAISTLAVLVVSASCFLFKDLIGYRSVALILLMTVSIIAILFEILPVLLSATLSVFIWNFFFIPPLFAFSISSTEDWLMFILYFLIVTINAVLTFKIKQAEKKARDREEKENAIRLYNTLLNSLSHELRTPISTIIGSVDTLKDNNDKLSNAQQSDLLNEISTAGIRLNRQVENILNMSRIESGMLQPKADWCDMTELVHMVIHKTTNTENRNIHFKADENLPLFKLDRGFIEQILSNLLSNAIQYTQPQNTIEISIVHSSDCCVITVSDNGNGIPENEIPLVFDKFYRLPNTRSSGSGLGLSIVKGFVEAQKGKLSLTNNSTGGAKFTIEIPSATTYINSLKNE